MKKQIKLKRPTFNKEMVAELAISVGEILKHHHDYNDLEDCINDAKSILQYHWDDDGFELAKEFDDKGYDGSTSLVDDLDMVSSDAGDILKKHIIKWVKENDINLELAVGALVVFNHYKNNNEGGEIVQLYPETAQYGVWCESLNKPKDKSHYIVNFEDIKRDIKTI